MKAVVQATPIPPAMKKALAASARARKAFDQLPVSHRNEYVKWITEARRPETVARRLGKLMPMLLAKAGANN